MRTTSGASASGSTALSRAALWHQSGSAHSYESEPSQNVVIATRRGWPEAAGCALQAASWRVASMRLLRRGRWLRRLPHASTEPGRALATVSCRVCRRRRELLVMGRKVRNTPQRYFLPGSLSNIREAHAPRWQDLVHG